MDVSMFRPFKQDIYREIELIRSTNSPEAVNLTNFHTLMMPIYLKCMKPETVINGFRKAGIHPFNSDNVDWSKVTGIAKQQEAFHSKEGIVLDGHVEQSVQTVPAVTVHSRVQTASSGECRHHDLAIKNHCGYSVDDLIIDKDLLCAVKSRARTINSSTIVYTERDPATRLRIIHPSKTSWEDRHKPKVVKVPDDPDATKRNIRLKWSDVR